MVFWELGVSKVAFQEGAFRSCQELGKHIFEGPRSRFHKSESRKLGPARGPTRQALCWWRDPLWQPRPEREREREREKPWAWLGFFGLEPPKWHPKTSFSNPKDHLSRCQQSHLCLSPPTFARVSVFNTRPVAYGGTGREQLVKDIGQNMFELFECGCPRRNPPTVGKLKAT